MSLARKILIPNISRKESCKAQISRGVWVARCFCDVSQHGPFPTRTILTQQPGTRLMQPLECLTSRRDPAFFWGAEPWLTQAVAGSAKGWNLCLQSLCHGPCHKLHRSRKYFLILMVCYLECGSVKQCQDLLFHFCYSLKEPNPFSFSSIF